MPMTSDARFTLTSALFVPATRAERFAKAAACGTDLVILDLEDAVAEGEKAAARAALVGRLEGARCAWRINAIDSPHHAADAAKLGAGDAPDYVMLPKSEAGAAFDAFAASCPVPIIALVESAQGIASVRALAAHPKVVALAFGTLDFCLDLDAGHIAAVLDPMRLELVLAARLAGIAPPIDGVTADLSDPAIAGADAQHARALGMGGKLAIHPNQIAPIRAGFAPSQDEIAWARKVMAVEGGVERVDGAMVDAPVKARAARLLARAGLS